MNETRIAELVTELDRRTPTEGAAVVFQQYGGGPDESKIVGNRLGYLRLGIELLKTGIASPTDVEAAREASIALSRIVSDRSDIYFDELELSDAVSLEPEAPRRGSRFVLGFFGVALAVGIVGTIGLAIIGLVSLLR